MSDTERLSHERVYDGKVFDIDRDKVRMPNGRTVTVDVVRHPKSVVLIPVPEPGHVILIRQYRYAVNAFLWELPAGSVDEGESPEQAARRECHEEIGKVPETIVRMAAMFPTPVTATRKWCSSACRAWRNQPKRPRWTKTRTSKPERSSFAKRER